MSDPPQRTARRAMLQLQCAHQRVRLAASLRHAHEQLQPIDRALSAVQTLGRAPWLVGGAATLASLVAASLLSGRRRPARARGAQWAEWLALAAPALQPLLGLVERWWRSRQTDSPSDPAPTGEAP